MAPRDQAHPLPHRSLNSSILLLATALRDKENCITLVTGAYFSVRLLPVALTYQDREGL